MEEIITSVKNDLVVKTKKIRDEFEGLLFLDNPKTIKEAYLSNLRIEYILIDIKKKDLIFSKYNFLKQCKTYIVSNNIIEFLSNTKKPQGIIAVVKIEKASNKQITGNCLILDNLQDPGNLGTIIRSAKGTCFKNIVLINCVSPYNQKVVRATMGALFFENYYFFSSVKAFIDYAKENNINLIVADTSGKSLYTFKKPKNIYGIVIGNEGSGVSKEFFENGQKVSIPMKNNLESLNAGVACSILMYYFDNL